MNRPASAKQDQRGRSDVKKRSKLSLRGVRVPQLLTRTGLSSAPALQIFSGVCCSLSGVCGDAWGTLWCSASVARGDVADVSWLTLAFLSVWAAQTTCLFVVSLLSQRLLPWKERCFSHIRTFHLAGIHKAPIQHKCVFLSRCFRGGAA